MNNLRKRNFKFNGYDFYQRRWFIVTIGDPDLNFSFGIDRSIDTIDTGNYPNVVGVSDNLLTIDVTFAQIGYNSDMLHVSQQKYNELCRLLYTTEPKALEVGGYTFYGIFTGLGTGFDNGDNGYVTMKFQLTTPYYTISKNVHEYHITSSKTIQIFNPSTASGYNPKPEIRFKLKSGNSITISNSSTLQTLTISGLTTGEEYIIFNEEKQIWSNDNDKMLFNSGDWLELQYGINNIVVNATECDITIQYNPLMGATPII